MTNSGFYLIVALLLGFQASIRGLASEAAATSTVPDFKDVYEQVRTHLEGATDAELNRAAVEGFLSELSPKVTLETGDTNNPPSGSALVSRTRVFDREIAYIRLAHIGDGAAQAVRNAYNQLASTNKLKGLVLDLRYTDGNQYSEAGATAGLFLSKEKPLLDSGTGVVRSQPKKDAISVPVAALVNHKTKGAAEALAAVLRATGTGLILGSTTAGQAMAANEFPLKNGQRLRIATAPIELADGSKLSPEGVKPDISVPVSPQDERAYYSDAFKVISSTNLVASTSTLSNQAEATNGNRRIRYNEAELVRERREALGDEDLPTASSRESRESEPEKPVIRDPVLGRAIDVLKGLAVVRGGRS